MKSKLIKYDLISNAKDSLAHAVEHLTNPDGVKDGDLKRAIRDVFHVIELLLKEKLRRIHPAFIWLNIDKYPSKNNLTVNAEQALNRLTRIAAIKLKKESTDTILKCKSIRNSIEHYEFEIAEKETRCIIGRMLSFIFSFSILYLEEDLEKEFKSDDRWAALVEIYEFWEAHSAVVEKELSANGITAVECSFCGAFAFVIDESKCALCEHFEEVVECDDCGESVFGSEIEEFEDAYYDQEGLIGSGNFKICKNCIKKREEYEPDFDDIVG